MQTVFLRKVWMKGKYAWSISCCTFVLCLSSQRSLCQWLEYQVEKWFLFYLFIFCDILFHYFPLLLGRLTHKEVFGLWSSRKSLTNNCSSCRPLLLQLQTELVTHPSCSKMYNGAKFKIGTWIKKRLFVCVFSSNMLFGFLGHPHSRTCAVWPSLLSCLCNPHNWFGKFLADWARPVSSHRATRQFLQTSSQIRKLVSDQLSLGC